ncbi:MULTISPECIES: helix-turn-helix domain-containing protein [Paenibacillaceae]|uniref:HTH cro/C1-type domain-containing protein n=1 Tax=Aneurinibacillus danicus TaxID=267746 RepID=A0A511VB35_9BACL|nr:MULTISPECIES: helix-turn-helix transcriptional regulator [Paenibacillaceae]GEN36135.1 hypothetical protein ADA01nite_35950 [Aneurinibacillus danicus]
METFASYLKFHRKAKGLTYDQLAVKVPISAEVLESYEKGERMPTVPDWLMLQRFFDELSPKEEIVLMTELLMRQQKLIVDFVAISHINPNPEIQRAIYEIADVLSESTIDEDCADDQTMYRDLHKKVMAAMKPYQILLDGLRVTT